MTICPNQLGQRAALWGMRNLGDWLAGERAEILDRRAAMEEPCRLTDAGWHLLGCGAYFAYLRHPFDMSSDALAPRLLRDAGVLLLPGTMFRPAGDPAGRHEVRIAFANVDPPPSGCFSIGWPGWAGPLPRRGGRVDRRDQRVFKPIHRGAAWRAATVSQNPCLDPDGPADLGLGGFGVTNLVGHGTQRRHRRRHRHRRSGICPRAAPREIRAPQAERGEPVTFAQARAGHRPAGAGSAGRAGRAE